ncbi:AlpA family phage regulatory protein [Umezawaea sp. Da 62-37]|jgi:predicted DNA-binding transcriptional regulator AlpA|nr:AlpA family phage regulatory protein [Umezawaea sp. Da 62-37]WNV92051.1 AlpA family phage regulatory protein [Umezawaea sp. Da 62-37]
MGSRQTSQRRPTLAEIKATWPAAVDVPTAATAFGMSRSKAYDLVARAEFPAKVAKYGGRFMVITESLIRALSAGD